MWEILTYMLNWIRKCSGTNYVSSLILRWNMISLVLFLSLSHSLCLITRMKIKSLTIYCLYFTIISFRYIFCLCELGWLLSKKSIESLRISYVGQAASLLHAVLKVFFDNCIILGKKSIYRTTSISLYSSFTSIN